jgi:hypothetical protein
VSWIALFNASIPLGAASKAELISEWPTTSVVVDGKAPATATWVAEEAPWAVLGRRSRSRRSH